MKIEIGQNLALTLIALFVFMAIVIIVRYAIKNRAKDEDDDGVARNSLQQEYLLRWESLPRPGAPKLCSS